jgi:hypothetical protein
MSSQFLDTTVATAREQDLQPELDISVVMGGGAMRIELQRTPAASSTEGSSDLDPEPVLKANLFDRQVLFRVVQLAPQ